jgi:hypothetical protein
VTSAAAMPHADADVPSTPGAQSKGLLAAWRQRQAHGLRTQSTLKK